MAGTWTVECCAVKSARMCGIKSRLNSGEISKF
jgi:hypothetical protein